MEQLQLPVWAKPSFDERFNEQARLVGKLPEIELLRLKRFELDDELKQELAPRLYQLVLNWEESLNHRNALEKEMMYLVGVKDGMKYLREIQDFVSG